MLPYGGYRHNGLMSIHEVVRLLVLSCIMVFIPISTQYVHYIINHVIIIIMVHKCGGFFNHKIDLKEKKINDCNW